MDILAICQKIKNLWHFEILTWESMGHLKCEISRIRLIVEQNGQKNWDSGYYSAHTKGIFDARFLEFDLGSFSALRKISNFTIFKTLPISPNFFLIHPTFIQGIIISQAITYFYFFWRSAKICKNYDIYSWNFQSAISPTIFIAVHLTFVTTMVIMVKLNAC